MATLSSSTAIVSFPEPKRGFAATSKSWLSPLLADGRLTHGETRLASKLYLYIDQKDWETTGELLIPRPIDQNWCAHWRNPMDMMRQG